MVLSLKRPLHICYNCERSQLHCVCHSGPTLCLKIDFECILLSKLCLLVMVKVGIWPSSTYCIRSDVYYTCPCDSYNTPMEQFTHLGQFTHLFYYSHMICSDIINSCTVTCNSAGVIILEDRNGENCFF